MWGNYGNQPGMMGYDGNMYWWMGLHGLISLLIIAAIVIGIVAALRYLSRNGGQPSHTSSVEVGRTSALALLDARYARGEIDRDEYLQKKKDLL